MASSERIRLLIGRIALGERAAFDALFDDMAPKLFGVLVHILKDRAQAEEALQEVFVRIWQRADHFERSGAQPETWLVSMARTHAIDLLVAREEPFNSIDIESVFDDLSSPSEGGSSGHEPTQLDLCLRQLEADKSAAIKAAYLEAYTPQELANRFGIPLKTMQSWLRMCLGHVETCLDDR